MSNFDQVYMRQALALAAAGMYTASPNPRVGCILVKDGQIIGQGYHHRAGAAHAEINALNSCEIDPRGATCYLTLEPCVHQGRTGPCMPELLAAGVKRVVVAMADPNPLVAGRGLDALRAAGVEVSLGVEQAAAQELNKGFIKRMTAGRPWVTSKIAMSLDGKIALAQGESRWITNELARHEVQELRARQDAILSTSATVIADDPQLTVRLANLDFTTPLRVILDPNLKIPPTARVFDAAAATILFTRDEQSLTAQQLYANMGVQILGVASQGRHLDLAAIYQELGARGVNYLLIEAGGVFNGHLLQQHLVDEWIIYQSSKILGTEAKTAFAFSSPGQLAQAPELELIGFTQLADNWRLNFLRKQQ